MKLNKFSMQKMSVAEMKAIKAGSSSTMGPTQTQSGVTYEFCINGVDCDRD